MSETLVVVSRAPAAAVALALAKQHLRVDTNDDDALITGYITAAVGHAERFMGRTLVDTTYDLVLDAFPKGRAALVLPMAPLIALDSVTIVDAEEDTETELDGIIVDSAGGRLIAPSSGWPTGTSEAGIRIRYRAGYLTYDGDASPPATSGEIPGDIVAALLLYIGSLYQQREDSAPTAMTTIPWSARQLLRMHRIERGMA
jgi:uncharacterized phiE125 gp8 family phage protein